jgi:hypothetical protein
MDSQGTQRKREICFKPMPAGQAERALRLLKGLNDLDVVAGPHPKCITVRYSLLHYTLKGLEKALASQGFELDDTFGARLKRALFRYSEEIDSDNLRAPEREQTRREIFARAYEHHPHGDRDKTPEVWREYK